MTTSSAFRTFHLGRPLRTRSRGRRLALALSAALLVLLAGCIETIEPPETLVWEGTLHLDAPEQQGANGQPTLTGSVAAITAGQETRVGVGIENGPEVSELGWLYRFGTCDAPGAPIAPAEVFRPIRLDELGEGERTVSTYQRLDRDAAYAAEIFAEADDRLTRLACADMERLQP